MSGISTLGNQLPQKYTEECITTLSAKQSKESVGKGYNGWHKATFLASQQGLKEIAGFKSLSELLT